MNAEPDNITTGEHIFDIIASRVSSYMLPWPMCDARLMLRAATCDAYYGVRMARREFDDAKREFLLIFPHSTRQAPVMAEFDNISQAQTSESRSIDSSSRACDRR